MKQAKIFSSRGNDEFSDAKAKGKDTNVYLNIVSDIPKIEVRRRINMVLQRHDDYTGRIIVTLKNATYFWDTESFRQKKSPP
jgi:hypothetical protein